MSRRQATTEPTGKGLEHKPLAHPPDCHRRTHPYPSHCFFVVFEGPRYGSHSTILLIYSVDNLFHSPSQPLIQQVSPRGGAFLGGHDIARLWAISESLATVICSKFAAFRRNASIEGEKARCKTVDVSFENWDGEDRGWFAKSLVNIFGQT